MMIAKRNNKKAVGVTILFLLALCGSVIGQNIALSTFPSSEGSLFSSTYGPQLNPVAPVGDMNGDGYGDFAVSSAVQTAQGQSAAGLVNVIFGQAAKFGSFSFASFNTDNSSGFRVWGPGQSAELGHVVAPAGDFNGDGLADLLISSKANAAYVVLGHTSAPQNFNVLEFSSTQTRGFSITPAPGETIGMIHSSPGDVNADGLSDILVYAPPISQPSTTTLYLVFGRPGSENIDLANFRGAGVDGFTIKYPYELNTYYPLPASRPCDLNGDGIFDVVIGGSASIDGLGYVPLMVIPGHTSGFRNYDLAKNLPAGIIYVCTGAADLWNDYALSFGCAGDFNGDAKSDLFFGSPWTSLAERTASGTAFILYGSSAHNGRIDVDLTAPAPAGTLILGNNQDSIGYNFVPAGDINNDNLDDMLLGTRRSFSEDAPGTEAAFLIYGSDSGPEVIDLSAELPPEKGFMVGGVNGLNTFSPFFSGVGDINSDGFDEFLFNNPTATPGPAITSYLVYGREKQSGVGEWQLY